MLLLYVNCLSFITYQARENDSRTLIFICLLLQVGWFKLITWPERWSNARRSCELEDAHLAIPDTSQKVLVLLQILKNYPDVLEQAILYRQVYVGLYSSGHDRNFSTVLGECTLKVHYCLLHVRIYSVSTVTGQEP
jgi:hypothetical protein